MAGPVAPVVIAVDPPRPGGAALAEARVQLAERQPEFPRQGNRLVSWAEAQSEADLGGDSHARSSLPTAHRRLFSACPGQKQNPCQLRSSKEPFASGLHECAIQTTLLSGEFLSEDPEFLTFPEEAQHPWLCEK